MVGDGAHIGPGGGERLPGGVGGEAGGVPLDVLDLRFRQHTGPHQRGGEQVDRVVTRFLGELLGRAVLALRVGRRVGERPGDLGVDEADAATRAHPVDRGGAGLAHGEVVAAVDAEDLQPGEARHEAADRPRRLVAAGHRDRPSVVGDDEQQRHLQRAGAAERFPELALRARTLTERDVGDLVATADAARKVAVVAQVARRLGAAEGDEHLRAGRARLGHDVPVGGAPVRRHLASAGRRVGDGADGLEEEVVRRHTEPENQRLIAVVGEEPVVAGPQRAGEAEPERLVPGARDLEVHLRLLLQGLLAAVDRPRQAGEPEVGDRLLGRDVVDRGVEDVGTGGHGFTSARPPNREWPSSRGRTARNADA